MRSPYKPVEIKAAMALKSITKKEIANDMRISRRTLDYFISGQMGMNRAEQFLEILQPELAEICKLTKKMKGNTFPHCEVK